MTPVVRLPIVFTLATFVWVAALVAAPYAVAHRPADSLAVRAAAAGYLLGSFICHQRPERSFRLWDVRMPVCARCSGMYAGAPLGASLALLLGIVSTRPSIMLRGRPVTTRVLMVAAAVPTVVTLVIEWTGAGQPASSLRALSGVPFGAAIAGLAAAGVRAGLR